jgi:hypothetical protein
LDEPRGDRLAQQPVGLLGAGDDEQAGGVAVETMHDAGTLGVTAGGGAGKQLGEGALTVATGRVHDEAGWLVDDQEVLVAVDHREGRRCRRSALRHRGDAR